MIPSTLAGRSTQRLINDLKNAKAKGDAERTAVLEAILAKRQLQTAEQSA